MDWRGVKGRDAWDAQGDFMAEVPSSSIPQEGASRASSRVPTALTDRELESFGPPTQGYSFVDAEGLAITQ